MKKVTLHFIIAALSFIGVKNLHAQTYYFPDTVTCFNWDDPNTEWDSSYRNIYTYNINGDVTVDIYQSFSTSWENVSKTENTYNSAFKKTKYEYFTWIAPNWVPSQKTEYIYDSNNNLIKETYFIWNGTAYDSSMRYLYTYDVNNKLQSYIIQSYSAGWVDASKTDYTYDSNGNVTDEVISNWNTITNQWDFILKIMYTYNTSNYVLTQINQNYSGGNWVNSVKREYTYNSGNLAINITNYFWNVAAWDSSFRMLMTYDVNGNKIQQITQSYQGGNWNNQTKIENTYNANDDLIQMKNYNWNAGNWEIGAEDTTIYNSNNLKEEWIAGYYNMGNYTNSQRCVYKYESITFTGIEETQPLSQLKCVVANPYSGQTIQCDLNENHMYRMDLFDIRGRLVQSMNISGGAMFTIGQGLENGMYIMRILDENGVDTFSKKLIISNQ